MKKFFLILGLFFAAINAEAKTIIFTCEPEWATLARQIVKNKAEIKVVTNADQDPRLVRMTSTLIAVARDANMIFCSGGGLESKWLPSLLAHSYNLQITDNDDRLMMANNYAEKLKIPEEKNLDQDGKKKSLESRARVHLNPHNVAKIAAEFTRRIKIIDPINANFYQESYEDFLKKWNEAIKGWEQRATPLKGMVFVANDDSWDFLSDWLGFKIITLVDRKTGFKPSAKSLHNMAKFLKKNPAAAIIFARYENKKLLLWLRDKTKTRMILLPFTVGGAANSGDFFQLFETTINSLLTDCSSGVCKTFVVPKQKKTDRN